MLQRNLLYTGILQPTLLYEERPAGMAITVFER